MIMTISGTPGSGKSTVAEILAKKLNAERIYVGGIRRELAREKNLTLQELNQYAATHPETDVEVDKMAAAKARELEKKGATVIVEGRTQFYFLPESVKIYMKVNPEEGAKRIWKDLQSKETQEKRNEGRIPSFEAMKKRIYEREEEDAARYKKYYSLDHRDESHYDLVIDTTSLAPEQVAEKITSFISRRKTPVPA